MKIIYKINKHTTRQIFKSVGERMSMQHSVLFLQHKIHNICTSVNINTYNFSLIILML